MEILLPQVQFPVLIFRMKILNILKRRFIHFEVRDAQDLCSLLVEEHILLILDHFYGLDLRFLARVQIAVWIEKVLLDILRPAGCPELRIHLIVIRCIFLITE